ncbi:hypothetical protein NLL29_10090 [Corynebacterium pseudodiphtheriticum]|uniref:hypothetical protein n=1 Tax=Corynebacterium pseudodiphtheriticum TaxID=37637 RepID=UPI002491CA50|nr:hypothetical protein [Corynebacterium pseudodiphtheriticum]WKS29988.1 hypothetical protein NLL29_10090 [Corynebacterium pseudodiphtheriticum]WKS51414.1 hypothetical protein NLL37_10080 [Corynebacterium pseudodiphtheriticum]
MGLEKRLSHDPLATVERACAITELIASAEYLVHRKNRQYGGLNDWTYLRSQFPGGTAKLWNKLNETQAEVAYMALHLLKITHNVALLSPLSNNGIRAYCNLVQSVCYLTLQPRQFFGTDGADQLSFLGNAASALGRMGGSSESRKAAADFLALQVTISYFISGVVKSPGKRWARGNALEGVMATETYGDRKFYRFLQKHPRIGRVTTRGTVILESLMPLAMINETVLKATLALFGTFHLANARAMGLGRFVLPFISTYPAILNFRSSIFRPGEATKK